MGHFQLTGVLGTFRISPPSQFDSPSLCGSVTVKGSILFSIEVTGSEAELLTLWTLSGPTLKLRRTFTQVPRTPNGRDRGHHHVYHVNSVECAKQPNQRHCLKLVKNHVGNKIFFYSFCILHTDTEVKENDKFKYERILYN